MHLLNISKITPLCLALFVFSVFAEHVGIDSITGSNSSSQQSRRAQKVTMPEDGEITSMVMYHNAADSSGLKMYLAVYSNGGDNKPDTRLAITPETDIATSTGWQEIDLDSSINVSSGTTLWLAWIYEEHEGIRWISGSPGYAYTSVTWGGGDNMPSDFGSSTLTTNANYCIYANYTPDAGGGPGGWSSAGGVTSTNDQVGIGTSTIPGGSETMLAVNGTIRAKEVIVTTQGWPDFVFKPSFTLKPLSDVEKYIRENNHLEGIPSEKEVSENGVPMGELQAKLLLKLEETTLYLIEMKKENERLKSRISAIENKVR